MFENSYSYVYKKYLFNFENKKINSLVKSHTVFKKTSESDKYKMNHID